MQISYNLCTGVHVGYSRSRRHPSTNTHIYAIKNRVDIIDLTQTENVLNSAKEFLATVKRNGKKVLFVGTKPEIKRLISDAGGTTDMPYVTKRWVGGMLTNFKEIQTRVNRLIDLEERRKTDTLIYRTKKERLMLEREIERLELNFSGVKDMKDMPGVMIVVDPLKEAIAVKEARDKNIPIIALCNTDCDISIIDFPIVGNDATQGSVGLILNQLIEAMKG
jgi:small subunit ribosomal protein S2